MPSSVIRKIPIVFISDDRYAMPTGVAITSLKVNATMHEDVIYEVYVVSIGLSSKSRERLKSLHTEQFHVSIIDYNLSEKQKSIRSNNGSHVSVSSIVKFDLANLFQEYDKVLYLDSDVLVLRSIIELWNTDISDCYAAAVIDGANIYEFFCKRVYDLNLDPKQYFNSGVLLLNTKKIREDGICEKLLEYRIHGKNYYMDQDALNVILYQNVRLVSPYYNLFNRWYKSEESVKKMSELYNVELDSRPEHVLLDAVILHFGDYPKPWNTDQGQLSGLFYSYYMLSPFRDRKDMRIKNSFTWSFPVKWKNFRIRIRNLTYTVMRRLGVVWLVRKIKGRK